METEREESILQIIRQKTESYKTYDIVYKGIMVLMMVLLTAAVLTRQTLQYKVYEAVVFLLMFVEYPAFDKRRKKTESAEREIGRALKIPGYPGPEAYPADAKEERARLLEDPVSYMKALTATAVFSLVFLSGGAAIALINISKYGEINIPAACVSALLTALGVSTALLAVLNFIEYRAAKKARELAF